MPKYKALDVFTQRVQLASWMDQDMVYFSAAAALGVASRPRVPYLQQPSDCLLLVCRQSAGIFEAKRDKEAFRIIDGLCAGPALCHLYAYGAQRLYLDLAEGSRTEMPSRSP